MKPTLKAPRSKRLKLEHEKLLSNIASKLDSRRYSVEVKRGRNILPLVRRCRLTISNPR